MFLDPNYPHRLALLPPGAGVAGLFQRGAVTVVITASSADDPLNTPELDAYMTARCTLLVQAEHARDLYPIRRREQQFRQRGYRIALLNPGCHLGLRFDDEGQS
jgi:hypothetical protein